MGVDLAFHSLGAVTHRGADELFRNVRLVLDAARMRLAKADRTIL
jgi:hypothetical protein